MINNNNNNANNMINNMCAAFSKPGVHRRRQRLHLTLVI